jgi:hypothetical protein
MNMEEKAHFKHEANIKLSMDGLEEHKSSGAEYTIIRMSNLQPMATKWLATTGETGTSLVYLDFYESIVYDQKFCNINDTKMGSAILEILNKKKSNTQNTTVPLDALDSVMQAKKTAEEGKPDARKLQF